MSSDQSNASADATRVNQELASKAYGIGIPALQSQLGVINAGLAGGGPQLGPAFEQQRVGLTQGATDKQSADYAASAGAGKAAAQGGNIGASVGPRDLGANLARSLTNSKLQEGMAGIEEHNNLLGMGLGAANQGTNTSLNAAGQQLNAIGMMPNYNTTYANILGAANAAYAGYGAYNQAFPGAGPTGTPLPMGTSYPPSVVGNAPGGGR